MAEFVVGMLFGCFRLTVSMARAIYSVVSYIVLMACLIVIVMAPGFFLLLDSIQKNPLFIVYLAGALVWPIIFFAIVQFAFGKNQANAANNNYSQSNDPGEPINASNPPIFSAQAQINAEIPYTMEHLAKYGSLD